MVITDFRVQAVLRTYGRQLLRWWSSGTPSNMESRLPSTEKGGISEETRRRLITVRVTSQALEYAYIRHEKLNISP